MDNIFSLAQCLGYISFGLGVATFYQKNDRNLKVLMLIYNLNHFVHYLLLGSIMSALAILLSAVRTGTSLYTSSKRVAWLFIIIGFAVGFYLKQTYWDLLPIIGTSIGTYAMFVLRGIKMRLCFLVATICWFINNILVGSIGGTLLEGAVLFMNIFTIYRLAKNAPN
ncbi:Permease of the major facilitator superfamily protein [Psychromonas sp. CNPT3]|uniref:YgjV family protein n=1 Tax=Psychromonas sp. CNPT3 TaxID=314282 RepID=UPI00006E7098|nr:YgjV family protein [Psychromonas sp. CNPT3]AGH80057.1 Permease of the major facilitator superfamily protein [Psychromonas sp. CNPT3]